MLLNFVLFKKFVMNNNKARYRVKICEMCGLDKLHRQSMN